MTEFSRTVKSLEKVVDVLRQVEEGSMDIEQRWHNVSTAKKECSVLEPTILKLKGKADITDEEKKVFGEEMVEKVKQMATRYFEIVAEANNLFEKVREEYLPHASEKFKADEAARAAQEVAEKARAAAEKEKAEEEQRKAEAEKAEKERLAKEKEELGRKAKEEEEKVKREAMREENERRNELNKFLDSSTPYSILKQSILQLQANTSDSEFETVVRGALQCIKNALGHPDNEMFRKIRKKNDAFSKEIGAFSGGTGLLFAAGFRETYNAEVEDISTAEVFIELIEPDPIEQYDTWNEWLRQTTEVKNTLEKVVDAITRHRYTHRPLNVALILEEAKFE